MQTSTDLWLFFALVFGVVALPGMDMAFVASSALVRGLRGGLVAVTGIVVAGMLHTIVGASGVAALLVLWPAAFNAFLVAGAAYMAWVGASLLRSTGGVAPARAIPVASDATIFRRAMLTCLLNPKAYAFMLAVFPAFIRSTTYPMPIQASRLGAVIALSQLLVYGTVAILVASAKQWTGMTPNGQRGATRVVGAALIIGAVATLAFAWRPANDEAIDAARSTTASAPARTAPASAT